MSIQNFKGTSKEDKIDQKKKKIIKNKNLNFFKKFFLIYK